MGATTRQYFPAHSSLLPAKHTNSPGHPKSCSKLGSPPAHSYELCFHFSNQLYNQVLHTYYHLDYYRNTHGSLRAATILLEPLHERGSRAVSHSLPSTSPLLLPGPARLSCLPLRPSDTSVRGTITHNVTSHLPSEQLPHPRETAASRSSGRG